MFMVVHCRHGCLGCSWLFIAAMVALAAHVVHARWWLQWLFMAAMAVMAAHGRSCPFVVAMDVCGCHGRSGRSWLFMAVHGCHGCSLPPWLPWMVLAIPYILAVPQFPAISRPALRLWIPSYLSSCIEPYAIIRFRTIGYRRVRAHRLAYGLGPSAIAGIAFFK